MASTKRSVPDLEPHPLLSRLLAKGVETCVFRGYIGPSDREDSVRLYPSLGCLSFFIEINTKDIVETAPAPTSVLPHNGTVLWVRNDAVVVFHGDQVTTVPVRSLRRPAPRPQVTDAASSSERPEASEHIEIVRGRLRINIPAAADRSAGARRGDCDVCASCRGCASCTSVCQSGPALQ